MNTRLNREKLIDYISQNKPEHLRAKINAYSDIHLIILKVGIELEKTYEHTNNGINEHTNKSRQQVKTQSTNKTQLTI